MNGMTDGKAGGIVGLMHRFEEWLVLLLVLATVLLACVQIGLRSLFSGGLVWADPLLRYMVLWTGLLGAAVATRMERHIAIDLASHLLPESLLPKLKLLVCLFAAGVCLALTWAALVFVRNEAAFDTGERLLGLARWQLNLIFPVVFALIGLRFLAGAFRALLGIFGTFHRTRG